MLAQVVMPCSFERMLEHLNLDIENCFWLVPQLMEDAMSTCLRCRAIGKCEDDVESHYFTCPNRNLLDQLERLQGHV